MKIRFLHFALLSFIAINLNLMAFTCDVTTDKTARSNYAYLTEVHGSIFANYLADYHCDYLYGEIDFFNFNAISQEFNMALVRGQGDIDIKKFEKIYTLNCNSRQEIISKTADLYTSGTKRDGARYAISTKCYKDGAYIGDIELQLEGFFSSREVLLATRLKVKSVVMNFR